MSNKYGYGPFNAQQGNTINEIQAGGKGEQHGGAGGNSLADFSAWMLSAHPGDHAVLLDEFPHIFTSNEGLYAVLEQVL